LSTINDYIGRTIDVVAFQGSRPRGDTQLTQALALPGSGGAINTGIAKLGQRFLLELLTELGSMVHWPERGSTFMLEVRSQRIRTATDLYAALARGLLDVRRNLRGEDQETDPLDEQYGGAEIVSVELTDGNAKVFIAVRSLDPTAVAIMPIEVSLAA
jgi:hypothetical protein